GRPRAGRWWGRCRRRLPPAPARPGSLLLCLFALAASLGSDDFFEFGSQRGRDVVGGLAGRGVERFGDRARDHQTELVVVRARRAWLGGEDALLEYGQVRETLDELGVVVELGPHRGGGAVGADPAPGREARRIKGTPRPAPRVHDAVAS